MASGGNWASPAAGTLNNDICFYNESNVATKPALGQTYTFTPPAPCVTPADQPSALVLTPTTSSVSGTFTAAPSTPTNYLVIRTPNATPPSAPVDGTLYTPGASALGGVIVGNVATTSFNATGLIPSTPYYFWLYSFNNTGCSGGPLYRTASPLSSNTTTLACSGPSGTIPVGPTGTYPSLTAAFAAIAGGISGPVIFELQATYLSTVETFPLVFPNNGCVGPVNNITIRPEVGAVGLSITSSNATATIDFNGANYVTIDGRPGGVGTTSQLTLANTATGTAVATRFINDAVNNAIRYCSIQGSTSASFGVVLFSTGIVTGNDNNTLSNNNISVAGANFPIVGIYSLGSSAVIDNSGNTVTDNNIFDIFAAASLYSAININSNNSGWTISNNKIYQTATRTITTGNTNNGIFVTSGNGYTISGNVIGFATSSGTGTMTLNSTTTNRYIGINCGFTAGTVNSIQGNTVTAISLSTSSGAATTNGVLCGINITGAGSVNIGNVTPNIIGASSGTGALIATPTTTQGAVVGINCSATGTIQIQNNIIGGLQSSGTTAAVAGAVFGINVSGVAASMSITGNTIGNGTANNMRAGTLGLTTGNSLASGINATSTSTIANYSNNTIQNFASYGTGTTGYIRGIQTTTTGTTTAATISGNTITNLTSDNANVSFGNGQLGAVGIYFAAGLNATISGNTISNISLINTTTSGTNAAGISVAAALGTTLSNNKIFNITNASTSTSVTLPGTVSGVFVRGHTNGTPLSFINNMISLGDGQSTNTCFIGLWSANSNGPVFSNNIYFNSIHISGNATSGAQPSFCFLRGDLSATARTHTVDVRNNIFNNTRISSGGGTGKHYAISNNYGAVVSTTGWAANASNYNVLNSASPATIGFWTTDQTFAGWKTASASDAVSQSDITVTFTNTATGDLHLNMGVTPTTLESGGIAVGGITTDYDNQVRPGPAGSTNGGALAPDLGADEFDGVFLDLTPPSISYTLLPNTLCIGNVNLSATITDASGINVAPGTKPRVYYKKTTNANTFNDNTSGTDGWKYAEASNAASPFTFTLNMALINGGVAGGDVIQYFVVAQDLFATPNVAINSGIFAAPPSSVALTAAAFPLTGTINSYTIGAGGLSGVVTIGAAGTYTSITGAGGLFAAINASGLSGNLTANILDASVTESGANALNQMAYGCGGPFTLLIKPNTGVTATLTGSLTSSLIKILSSNVTIDGSNNGTASRDLTITNTSVTTPTVLLLGSTGTVPINNITVKNSIIINGANTNTAVFVSDGTTAGNAGYFNNITFQNNNVQRAYIGIYNIAVPVAGNGSGLLLTGNDLSTSGANSIRLVPLYVQGADGATVSNNTLGNVANTADASNITGIWFATATINSTISGNTISGFSGTTSSPRGIVVTSGATNSNVNVIGNTITNLSSPSTGTTTGIFVFSTTGGVRIQQNNISNIKNSNGTGFGSNGIQLGSTLTAAAIDVFNNYVSDIAANGFNGTAVGDNGYGIIITAGGGSNLYYNTVVMNTEQVSATGLPAALNVTSGVTTANSLNIRNNIFSNTQTIGGQRYCVFSGAAASVYADINYNDYYFTGPNLGNIGGTLRADLVAWQAGTTKDAQSKSAQPIFVSGTDFHLSNALGANWCLNGTGQTIATYTTDYDGDTRGTPPDIGADEFTAVGDAVATPNNQTICSGATITTIALTGTAASFSWTRDNVATVTGIAASGTGNISGALTNTTNAPITVTFTISPVNAGGCNGPSITATVLVNPTNTITLTSAPGTDAQTVCINTPITNITYVTTFATGATFSGLPAGVTGSWAANVVTISGTPTASGTFNYTVTLTGGCGSVSANGSITVSPNNTISLSSAPGTNAQTVCINTAITNITYNTTGATGATFSGLPAGVTGGWAANVVTISGTPTASGTFNYTVTLTGGCGSISANGTITVTPNNTISLSSAPGTDAQTVCINTAITNITYSTTGATGATFSGLPAGVTGNWAANVVTISGSPTTTVGSPFSYTVTLTGGCGVVTATGTITVTPNNTITLTSAAGTNAQTVCINTAITNITYSTTGATGATFSGLPAGVTGNWAANVVTISGSPTTTVGSPFIYTVILTGGCGVVTATGTITVTPNNTITLTSAAGTNAQTVCINTPITNITYSTTGATGATFSGLPAGVTGNWAANVVTISGSPTTTVGSPFSYTVTLTGGCGSITANGTITVTANNTISLTSAPATTSQIVCVNTPITNITYATTGATGATFSGLPAGVTGSWAANVVTISGTPTTTVGSPFSYTVTLTGGCGTITANGTITVMAVPVVNAPTVTQPTIPSPTGTIVVNATGGPTLEYSLNGGPYQLSNTFTGLLPGGSYNISVRILNSTGCVVTYAGNPVVMNTISGRITDVLVGSSPFQDSMWTINLANYTLIRYLGPTLSGFTITGINALATNPLTGEHFAIVKVSGSAGRRLVKINVQTGVCTLIGNMGDNFSTLAFRTNGELYSITGNGSSPLPPETMYKIDTLTGLPTFYRTLGNGADGEVIAFNPDDNFFYHWSGNSTVVWEKFATDVDPILPLTSPLNGEVFGALYAGGGQFWVSNISSEIRLWNIAGTAGPVLMNTPDDLRGLVRESCSSSISPGGPTTFCSGNNVLLTVIGGTGNYQWYQNGSLIGGANSSTYSATTSGLYNCIYTDGCGLTDSVTLGITVTVIPTPDAVATPSSQTICNGSPITTIALTGSVPLTTFNWTRDNVATVTGIAASGSGNISGILNNTTNSPVTVTFTIIPSTVSCIGTPITATVTVNPIPDVNQPANQVVCNNTSTLPVNFTGLVAGTIFNWTNTAPSIGLAASGTGDIASFTATNATGAPVVATITVTPTTIAPPVTQTFNYTGGMQTFTVPAGITSVTIDAYGAQGGSGAVGNSNSGPTAGGNGGLGTRATGTLAVTPGQVLNIFVGGAGATPTGASTAAVMADPLMPVAAVEPVMCGSRE
ncbi:MAG: hypothetical protein IPI66_00985 [Chitinophagaceae bacterium]|nr:hypothetical protein [Chitinophagaceae bacterium]